MKSEHASREGSLRKLPRNVWAFGVVSLFMDVSSEMIHGLLPVFLTSVLGASTEMVGLIEGIGEGTAAISKLFSGWVSDRLGNRKVPTVIGYSLSALSKPLFAIASSPMVVLGARFSDRVGKGTRGAPRDAMISEMVPQGSRGAAYGLRQALDTVGAFAGPLIAIGLMAVSHRNFRLVFWLAAIPAVLSVLVLVLGVREPRREETQSSVRLKLGDLKSLSRTYWIVIGIAIVLTLARFSEAFLILRAQSVGLPVALAPVVLVVMNVVYAASAYPAGAASDRLDRRAVLAIGFIALIAADIILAMGHTLTVVMVGVAVWGLHMGFTEGLLDAFVADEAPVSLRGTAFGLYNFSSGIALLVASLIAGALWDAIGPSATFIASAALTAAGLLGAVLVRLRIRVRTD